MVAVFCARDVQAAVQAAVHMGYDYPQARLQLLSYLGGGRGGLGGGRGGLGEAGGLGGGLGGRGGGRGGGEGGVRRRHTN